MIIKEILKKSPVLYQILLNILFKLNWYNYNFWKKYPKYKPNDFWAERIETVKKSPDNKKIIKSKKK